MFRWLHQVFLADSTDLMTGLAENERVALTSIAYLVVFYAKQIQLDLVKCVSRWEYCIKLLAL